MQQSLTLDMTQVQEYAALVARKRELEAELRAIQDRLNEMEPGLVEQLIEAGVQHVRVGGQTVYLQQEIWASPVDGDYDALCDALERAGLGDMVVRRVHHHTLSAWVRELRKADEEIPEEVRPYLKISETYRLGVRKAGD
jgi:hypothetical protein